jgi:ElaB/YqjD/DUF883 family membrane-anchored ribosome-binding protein
MAEENYANQPPAGSSQARVDEGIGQGRGKRGKNLRPSARLSVAGEGVWNDARQRLSTLKQDTDDYVRKNPTKAVFTALGIGFVLALMRRR